MDRAPFQVANIHELLRSTLSMFADRLRKDVAKAADKNCGAINRGKGLR
jgi:hypothetical protein